ncbi:GDP-D-glucose phosphorylase 1 [Cetorhinus maximus]
MAAAAAEAAAVGGDPDGGPAWPWAQAPVFSYSERDLIRSGVRWGSSDSGSGSRFDAALLSAWEERMDGGCFRYRLPSRGLPSRRLPGPRRFVAQLNPQRATERRRPQEILSLRQPFEPERFNFTRIPAREVLFQLGRGGGCPEPGEAEAQAEASALLIVNVSPLERGHVLLVPEPARGLPQLLTRDAVLRALELVFLSSEPAFRVGFNSLGAWASVNHLHLHGYYLGHRLELESAPSRPLGPSEAGSGPGRRRLLPVHLLRGPPGRGLLVYTDGGDLPAAALTLHALGGLLVRRSLAHNLFLCRGCPPGDPPARPDSRDGVRIVLWPRRSCFGLKGEGEGEEEAFKVALCELAGHLPIKNPQDYSSLTEEKVLETMEKYLLPEEEFSQLVSEVTELLKD